MVKLTHFNVPSTAYAYRPKAAAGNLETDYVQIKVEPVSADTGKVTVTLDARSPGLSTSGGPAIALTDAVILLSIRGCDLSAAASSVGGLASFIRGSTVSWYRPTIAPTDNNTYSVNFKWKAGVTRQRYQVTVRADEYAGLIQVATAREALPPT